MAGLRLPVVAVLCVARDRAVFVEGAVIDLVDLRVAFCQLGLQPVMQRLHPFFGVVATGDTGPVGDDRNPHTLFK